MDATMIVVGSMIGSGIFIVSADMLRNVGSSGYLILGWVLTGVLTLIAAVSYGELSAMYPKAGGQYVYLREAYNPLVGFLYGWAFFAVIQTGTIAAVGVAFSKFSAYIFPALSEDVLLWKLQTGADACGQPTFFSISAAQVVSILLVLGLTFLNTRGVRSGKIIQSIFTATKLISLFGLIIFGFILAAKAEIWNANWLNAWDAHKIIPKDACNKSLGFDIQSISGIALMGGMAAAMVGSVFSSDAWNNITFVAGEVKNPQRNIGLSLILGTLTVTVIYLLMNMMYLSVIPLEEIAHASKDRVGVVASEKIFGTSGTIIIALMIMISTFGCNNGLILSGARVYYTMAKDGLFFKQAGELNKNSVPEWGLWIQCAWACVLCLSGKYGDLLDYVVFVVLLFYILTIAGIFILRVKKPEAVRPYKAWGYPVLPALYIVLALVLSILLFIFKPQFTYPGLGIILLGIPIYYIAIRNRKKD